MAEAVAAIGVAAAAVQFFDFSLKTLTLCKQIHDSEKSATEANQELETSIGKLKQITKDLQLNVVLPAVYRPITIARQDCVAAIGDLEKLLEGVKPKSRKYPFATARSAFRAIRSKPKIEALRNKVSEAHRKFIAAASVDTRNDVAQLLQEQGKISDKMLQALLPGLRTASDDDALTLTSLEINHPPHDTLSPSDQLFCTKPLSDAAASHPDTDESSPNVEESQNAASLRRNIWAPLQEGQMRLLGLMGGDSGRIGLRMQTVDIDSAPEYFALSYVCGDQISDCEIEVDGHLFLVRPNLFATLQKLKRDFEVSSSEPLFWIDAISINQLDGDEKASQIRELHRIFSSAEFVLIALGRLSDNAALAFGVLGWAQEMLIIHLAWASKRYKAHVPIIPQSLDEPLWCSGPESLDNDNVNDGEADQMGKRISSAW